MYSKLLKILVSECSEIAHNCGSNAACSLTEDSYECSCDLGFRGNGQNCTDIDECEIGVHNCVEETVCKNTVGSYSCDCKLGYNSSSCEQPQSSQNVSKAIKTFSKRRALVLHTELSTYEGMLKAALNCQTRCNQKGKASYFLRYTSSVISKVR